MGRRKIMKNNILAENENLSVKPEDTDDQSKKWKVNGRKKIMKYNVLAENENSSVKLENIDDESKKRKVNVSESLQCFRKELTAIPEIPECFLNGVNHNFNGNNKDYRIDDHNENGEGPLSDSCLSDSSIESLKTRIHRKVISEQKRKLLGDGQGNSPAVLRKRKRRNAKDLEPENVICLNPNLPSTSGIQKSLQAHQKDGSESVKKHKNNVSALAEIITHSEGRKKFMRNNVLAENENLSVKPENIDDESKKLEVNVSKSLQCFREKLTAIREIPECSLNGINHNFNGNNQDCRIGDHNENGKGSLSDSCLSDSSIASLKTRIHQKVRSEQKPTQLGGGQGTSSTVSRKRKRRNVKDLELENIVDLNPNIPTSSGTQKPLQAHQKYESDSVKEYKNNISATAEIITHSEGQGHKSENTPSLLAESCVDSYPFLQKIPQQHEVPETKTVVSSSDEMHSKSQKWNPEVYEWIIASLESKLKQYEETNLTLEKLLKEADVKFITEEVKQSLSQGFRKKLEDLHCTICTELCIQTVVLNCSHSFCKYCITEWKKKKNQCPICRESITTETLVLALDQFIEKVTDLLSEEEQERRKELIESRKKHRGQRRRRTRRRGQRQQQSRRREQSGSVDFAMQMDEISTDPVVIATGREESYRVSIFSFIWSLLT